MKATERVAGAGQTPKLRADSGWLWANLAAMGFSLAHAIADFGVMFGGSGRFDAQQSVLTVVIGALYAWWAWAFARAAGGVRSALAGLVAFNVLWATLNGITILGCLPPCGSVPFYGDALHLGTLVLGPLAALLAYRAARRTPGRGDRLAMAGNVLAVVAFLAAIFGVLAWVAATSRGGF